MAILVTITLLTVGVPVRRIKLVHGTELDGASRGTSLKRTLKTDFMPGKCAALVVAEAQLLNLQRLQQQHNRALKTECSLSSSLLELQTPKSMRAQPWMHA